MDLKCPTSKMSHRNRWENIEFLKFTDEVKFVIENRDDYNWACLRLKEYQLEQRAQVIFSPVFNKIEPALITSWLLEDQLDVRFQLQLHKLIWDPATQGV